MEAGGKSSESLSIEQVVEDGGGHQAREYVLPSAHTIDHGINVFDHPLSLT